MTIKKPSTKCDRCSVPLGREDGPSRCNSCQKVCPHCGEELEDGREEHELCCADCKAEGKRYLDD